MIQLIAKIISLLVLVALIAPSIMYLAGKIELDQVKIWMTVSTIVWFISASLWMWKEKVE